ncbi:helix-turn-helix [Clostridium sp. CAG:921]|nr:helix-turn-helix [Clostridium sp. CAG:921]
MEKMNRNPERSYAICVDKDMQIIEERAAFEEAMTRHDFERADEYMTLLKEKAGESILTKNYVRRESAFLDFYQNRITSAELVEILEELAEETVPDYRRYMEEKIIFPFTEQEIILFKRLAVAYGRNDKNELALEICEMLLRSLRSEYMVEWKKHEIKILGNIVFFYQRLKKYEIACEIEKNLLEEAKECDNGVLVEEGIFDRAWDILREIKNGKRKKEEIEMCKKMMRKAYYLSLSRNDQVNMKIFSEYYATQFGESIGETL